MRAERARLSRHADTAKAIDYMLKRWQAFTRFLDDGRICLTNNAAERALRGIALGRRAWLFAGSDRGGERAAAMYTLIATAKLNDIDPQAWLADVLARIADHPGLPAPRTAALALEDDPAIKPPPPDHRPAAVLPPDRAANLRAAPHRQRSPRESPPKRGFRNGVVRRSAPPGSA